MALEVRERARGFVTFIHCGWVGMVGAALMCKDQLSDWGIDMKSLVGEFVPAEDVGGVMLGLALLFGYMRYVSTTPPFKSE